MIKKSNVSFVKQTRRGAARRTNMRIFSEFSKETKKLSYKQLLRVNSVVKARTTQEQKSSRLFVRSLTPPELRVAKAITGEMNHPHKKRKISILQKELERKNQEEIAHIDIQSILEERKQSSEL